MFNWLIAIGLGVTIKVGLSTKSFAPNAGTKGYRCNPSRGFQKRWWTGLN